MTVFGILTQQKKGYQIKYLAYVTAKRKYENHKVYFFYKDIKFYELKGLDEFLNLIEKGVIKICFKVGVYKKGRKLGNIYDHGTGFEISKKDLSKLYKRINYQYNNDIRCQGVAQKKR